ncbi:major facilitator superfamily domain-containing protein [Polychytrium aggregatum]|uniref:major facilitator superfamily domain-containing protein n=1 Tax=Polychytrium aggregatum TaxID=110093 RepID=UPI0022FEACA0|nr:major facilitator superfamily domain-containing protein [Polychytrium aggregatum]KAI9205918.1 major facilitator superfamily domain-containing protein [Polychytrium aggregatum]
MSAVEAVKQKRAKAYAHLDEAKLGWFHLRAVLVSGAGFFTDQYDNFIISLALPMIYQVYYPSDPSMLKASNFTKQYPDYDAWMKAATPWGNFVGQVGFGYLGDKLGRKNMYGIELIVIIVSTIGSAFSASSVRGANILQVLAVWRFFLGIGIGGDYPLSAIITSEFANVKWRGMLMAAVFSMQGVGILVGALVTLATLAALQSYIVADPAYLDLVWRIMIGFGVIPAMSAIYFRLTIPETPRYTVDVIGAVDQAAADVEKVLALNSTADVSSNWKGEEVAETRANVKKGGFWAHFGQWKHGKVLIGTSVAWFCLDVAWYGLTLNQGTVLTLINWNGSNSLAPYDNYFQKTIGQIIIVSMGTLPGFIVVVALIEKLGRKPIQLLGFGVIAVCLFIIAGAWNTIKTNTVFFTIVYTIAQFFFQFGPNTTTFVVPGEVFPTRFRSTAHGISAGLGKLGAIVGTQAISGLWNSSPTAVIYIFAGVMVVGGASTFLIPETKGKTLEELSGDDEVFHTDA